MKIFIAIPCYEGTITAECADSLLKNTHILRDVGHTVVPYFHARNPYIAGARNVSVHNFLRSDCDEIFFIDADVGFEEQAMLKLLRHDKEIVAGVYPYKQDQMGFPTLLKFDEITNNCKDEETGLVTVEWLPTGFLRIKRSVFEKMIEYYQMDLDHEGVYSFFDTGKVFENDPKWYGEDIVFCKRWRTMGGELFIEPRIDFIHTGIKHYRGNFHEYLMGRKVSSWQESIDKNSEGIDGWMTDEEQALLRKLAAESQSVVEVGSWKGRSTKALLETCKGPVYAVDHWKGTLSDLSSLATMGKDIYQDFLKNVGHYPNLHVLKGASVEMAKTFNGNMADMVFIDADHSYEGCKSDIEAWLPKCRKFICGHDYTPDFPGVVQAVTEKFGEVKTAGSIWWTEVCK